MIIVIAIIFGFQYLLNNVFTPFFRFILLNEEREVGEEPKYNKIEVTS